MYSEILQIDNVEIIICVVAVTWFIAGLIWGGFLNSCWEDRKRNKRQENCRCYHINYTQEERERCFGTININTKKDSYPL